MSGREFCPLRNGGAPTHCLGEVLAITRLRRELDQGYLLSRPLPVSDFLGLLETSAASHAANLADPRASEPEA